MTPSTTTTLKPTLLLRIQVRPARAIFFLTGLTGLLSLTDLTGHTVIIGLNGFEDLTKMNKKFNPVGLSL